jgi:hypothetical protein
VANDSEISTNRASIVLVYIDATKGWLYTNESNVADLGLLAYITATGGTIQHQVILKYTVLQVMAVLCFTNWCRSWT